jgi:hypothetical protein
MSTQKQWRPGPETPRAVTYDLAFCGSKTCGLHIVPHDENGTPLCEIVMSAEQTLGLIGVCQRELYEKATRS